MGDGTSSSNAFLRNLSQKKYSWMQPSAQLSPAANTTTTPATATAATTTTPADASSSTSTNATASASNSKKETSNDSKRASSEDANRVSKKPRHIGKRSVEEDGRKQVSGRSNGNSSSLSPAAAAAAAATTTTTTTTLTTASNNNPTATSSSNITPSRSPSPTLDLPALDDDALLAPRRNRVKRSQPRFRYTSFPVKGFSILPTRNITSGFDKTDTSYFPGNKAGSSSIAPNPEEEWRDTIIIHPGSRNLRIGRSSEAFPRTVPHVIARRVHDKKINNTKINADVLDFTDRPRGEEALTEIRNELKWRMKAAKRRAVPNADVQVVSFNSQAVHETIPDHNDPYKVEWTEVPSNGAANYFVGDKALNLPIDKHPEYQLFYPWKHGSLNHQDYDSIEAVLGDLQTIWTETIRSELDIEDKTFENFNVVLVIPDVFSRRYTSELLTMLLRHMKFRGALVQQESSCATFGAGVSSACVVDVGAQKTTIACIEDGVCFPDSRMTIAMGGDDITKTFASFLLANKFPYGEMDLSRAYDWRLVEELKEKWCTMNEADISVQVYDFFVRAPDHPTQKYQCKVYDEVFLAPLCLVYPGILDARDKTANIKEWSSTNVIDDITDEANTTTQTTVPTVWQPQTLAAQLAPESSTVSSDTPTANNTPQYSSTPTSTTNGNTPSSSTFVTPSATPAPTTTTTTSTTVERSNLFDVYPVDIAIAKSIQAASGMSDDRLKRFFTNIILVGGGGMISNFNRVLEDRVFSTFIAQRAAIERVEVLPAPRELDPRLLMWKGASVLSKLETAKEMWIGEQEWSEMGSRCLRERALFT
ncbi:chromatin remodeling complex subunit [Lichtheimia corymbifera JMRC:FSU:9682]|uniref:Chromatin remodeling complex subunit n=1 Tax=Lichtheimia corymbifera JMRC:FSU:9682 TaxID=1263082 RepID=A0A068S4B5_9FUNG|nr:chromatin remodeling complex subunit [Lichtheimia corymbifera JMRC:FSU:9682]